MYVIHAGVLKHASRVVQPACVPLAVSNTSFCAYHDIIIRQHASGIRSCNVTLPRSKHSYCPATA